MVVKEIVSNKDKYDDKVLINIMETRYNKNDCCKYFNMKITTIVLQYLRRYLW